jgi:signal transduction histidine kinase
VPQEREEREPRLARLLRHLGEEAERETAARAGLAGGLAAVLDAPIEGDLAPLLHAVTAAAPALDVVFVLAAEAGSLRARAALGMALPPGPAVEVEGFLADARRAGEPRAASGLAAPPPPLPTGVRAALALPLTDARGTEVGLAVFATRSAEALPAEAMLLARVAAERAARALERGRVESALARSDEADRRASGFRDQVLAIVGHDLRNPLGAIVMSAALLQKRGGLTGWHARTVERVRAAALRMGRIIDDLLTYTPARLGAGIPIRLAPADLGELTRRMVDELRAAHPAARLELTVEGDTAGEWDGARLEQAVSNLVSNAVDHGDEDAPVAVTVRGAGGEVRLEVTNRGEMPPAVLEHAFEAFTRGPEGTGRKASGLGLGLYIAREIARRHGGDVAIASRGGMTRVALALPRRTAAASPGRFPDP